MNSCLYHSSSYDLLEIIGMSMAFSRRLNWLRESTRSHDIAWVGHLSSTSPSHLTCQLFRDIPTRKLHRNVSAIQGSISRPYNAWLTGPASWKGPYAPVIHSYYRLSTWRVYDIYTICMIPSSSPSKLRSQWSNGGFSYQSADWQQFRASMRIRNSVSSQSHSKRYAMF